MVYLNYLIIFLVFCLTPAAMIYLCKRVSWLGKIGPVLILYLIGIIIGNLGIMTEELKVMQTIFTNAMIPLAIPLMLFSSSFKNQNTRDAVLALVTGVIAIVIAVAFGYILFGKHIEEGAKVGAMLSGVYTGGTVNLAAIHKMLGVSEETFILTNSYDMLVSFLYLTFLMTVGIKLFRRFLPVKTGGQVAEVSAELEASATAGDFKNALTKKGLKDGAIALGVTLLICAISGGLAILAKNFAAGRTMLAPDDVFMVVFILLITTGGIIASFIKPVNKLSTSYDIGLYCIYIFSIAVASMADLSNLKLLESLNLLGYVFFAVFASLFIQTLLAKLFKIDSDTMVICSVAFINSPPFVPMIVSAMKNRQVLAIGLSLGIIGYAIGNYLGIIIYQLLLLL